MNDILNPDSDPMTMTSREIAELTGKEHRNVMRDIRTMLVDLYGEGGVLSFEHTHTDPQNGQAYPIFILSKREVMILTAGYNVHVRAKIIDRWYELEQQAATGFNPASLSRMDILKMAMDSEDGRIKAEAKLAIAAPKAEALDRISLSDGAMCVTNAAKVLGLQPKKLFAWLQLEQWIYRRAGGSGYVGYQNRVQVGYLDHKVTTIARSDGSEKTVEQVLITAKGLAKLASAIPGAGSSLVSA